MFFLFRPSRSGRITALAVAVLVAFGLRAALAQTPTHVSFIQPLVCFCAAPLYAADKLGYFKDEGLDVDLVTVNGSAAMFAAVQSGSAAFGFTNGLTLLTSVPKGLSLVAFVGLDKGQGGFNMVVSNAWAQAHGIKANENYRTVLRKLAGAKIGVLGTTGTGGLLLASFAKSVGLADDALSMISMTPAASNAALAHGEIDAWWQTAAGIGGVLAFRSSNLPKVNAVVGNAAFTTRDFMTKNRDVVARMARAIARGDNALLDPRTQERALGAVFDRMPNLPHEEIRAEVLLTESQARARNGELTASMFDATNQIDAQLGLLKEPLTPEQLRSVYTLEFIPKRFVAP
jgi:ABC-type nitrate/sulfonate/bicarbonate transport system substrate-binding protein